MSFSNITDTERTGKGTLGIPDAPNLSTADMQKKFDELANLAITGFNRHITEESANTAASNTGAVVPNGLSADANIQSIINAMQSIMNTNKPGYDRIVSLLKGITGIESSVTNDSAQLATAAAIYSFVIDHMYTLPTASYAVLGGVKIDGKTILIDNGSIYAPSLIIDHEMSDTSDHTVMNKIIKKYVDGLAADILVNISSINDLLQQLVGWSYNALTKTFSCSSATYDADTKTVTFPKFTYDSTNESLVPSGL